MKTTSLEILEKAELPTKQAHAILKVFEQEMASSQENLATKADIVALQAATKADIAALQLATQADLTKVRLEIKGTEGRTARWILTCMLGQTAVLMGWISFVLSHSGGH